MSSVSASPIARFVGLGALAMMVIAHFRNASASTRIAGDANPYATYLKNR